MASLEALHEMVYQAIRDVNQDRPSHLQLSSTPQTVLIGENEGLDSLGLIDFVVRIEKAVADRYGVEVTLAEDEEDGAQLAENLSSVHALVECLARLTKE